MKKAKWTPLIVASILLCIGFAGIWLAGSTVYTNYRGWGYLMVSIGMLAYFYVIWRISKTNLVYKLGISVAMIGVVLLILLHNPHIYLSSGLCLIVIAGAMFGAYDLLKMPKDTKTTHQ